MLQRTLGPGVVAFAAALGWATAVCAVGMRVSPGGALIQGVKPGERHRLRVPITVMNDDGKPHTVSVTALRPAKRKMKLPPGYVDIPDPAWVSFSDGKVMVPARGRAAVTMSISIPEDPEYLNQHWSVAVAVPIEQPPQEGMKPPAGHLVVTPSVVTLSDVVPGGTRRRVSLRVWNNTATPWRGRATLIADAAAAKAARLARSGRWNWLQHADWVALEEPTLQIGPRESAQLTLEVSVPKREDHYDRSREAIVLVQGADGSAAFARLRIRTVPLAAAPGDAGGAQPGADARQKVQR